jgi:hypothetical protein
VDEGGHVDELDGRARRQGRVSRTRGEEDQQRPQPLAACGQRLAAHLGSETRMRLHRSGQPLLEVVQVGVEPGALADGREAHAVASPVCNATMEPANRRQ